MQEIRFDDVAALEAHVSAEFGEWSDEIEVSQETINGFADLTGDHQWIHVDVERAKKESPFGAPIAHGFLTLSLLPAMAAKTAGRFRLVGAANAVNYGSDKLSFLSPVPAGSKIHSRMRLASVTATEKGTRVENEVAIHVVGSERPALLYSMIVLYQGPRG
jgi:acyl dehydratase